MNSKMFLTLASLLAISTGIAIAMADVAGAFGNDQGVFLGPAGLGMAFLAGFGLLVARR